MLKELLSVKDNKRRTLLDHAEKSSDPSMVDEVMNLFSKYDIPYKRFKPLTGGG